MQEIIEEEINKYLKDKGYNRKIQLLQIADHLDIDAEFCFIANSLAPHDPESEGKKIASQLSGSLESVEKASIAVNASGKNPIVYINVKVTKQLKKKYNTEKIKRICEYVSSNKFGKIEDNKGKIAIVEHTSANPISPIHVGNLRNTIQGDTFARMLESTGYTVFRHYFVNDGGLQIGFTVIGYEILKKKSILPSIKFDLWLGRVYAIMNQFYNTQKIKEEFTDLSKDKYIIHEKDLEKITVSINQEISEKENRLEEINLEIEKVDDKKLKKDLKRKLSSEKRALKKLKERIDDAKKYYKARQDLKNRFTDLYSVLYTEVKKINLIEMTAEYLFKYEQGGDTNIVELFREMANWTLECFKWSLARYGIKFDSFDFETDITWSKRADKLLKILSEKEECIKDGKALRFKYSNELIKKFMKDLGLSKKDLKIRGNIPDLQLSRSDGTALYVMKDLAYTLQKFEYSNADIVYNVVGEEQALAQFQLLPLLYSLGYKEYAKNLHHYGYEIVTLVGRTMSGRLARYVTADQFFDETYIRSRMAKRASALERGGNIPQTDEEFAEEENILRSVTLASTRFPLIESSPHKNIQLDLDRELDMKRNSGPFVLYAHARANGILLKVKSSASPDYSALWNNEEVILIIDHLNSFDDTLRRGIKEMDPSKLTDWVFKLSQLFMKFYEKNSIIREKKEGTKNAKISLVKAVKNALTKSMAILGIPVTTRI